MKWDELCPICGKEAMEASGYCGACGADLGGVNVMLVLAARRRLGKEGGVDWDKLAKEICGEHFDSGTTTRAYEAMKARIEEELRNAFVAGKECAQDGEVVWENECHLVLSKNSRMGADPTRSNGTMGLDYPDGTYLRVNIQSYDPKQKHEIFGRLEKVPVRVTIRRVPGGNV